MATVFKKATKEQSKLRLAIFGPSGAGKTYSALEIATGLGDKIALIDTERGSASKYADKFEFDVAELEDKTIDGYIDFITMANGEGYDVLVIDSLSHGWAELLEEIDRLAESKFKGNKWRAWGEGTPKQKKFIDAILSSNCHIIATMRSKIEYTVDEKGRPSKVGLAPEQGKGIEYEFDMLMEVSPEHTAFVSKDRTGRYQDKTIPKPSRKLGEELKQWLSEGATPEINENEKLNNKELQALNQYVKEGTVSTDQAKQIISEFGYNKASEIPKAKFSDVFNRFTEKAMNKEKEAEVE